MKAVVAAFNQEKALVGAFSVIVQPVVEPMDRFSALVITSLVFAIIHSIYDLLTFADHLLSFSCADKLFNFEMLIVYDLTYITRNLQKVRTIPNT